MECVATSITLDKADSFPGSPTSQSEDSMLSTKPFREVSYQGPWGIGVTEKKLWHCASHSRLYICEETNVSPQSAKFL